MSDKRIIIAGAGLAGLSAAWHLQSKGVSCTVFEKEAEVGGLCRTKNIDGFKFDYDGHLLHFRHRYVFDLVKKLLKDNLAEHRKDAWVNFHGFMVPYPFQANLRGLPGNVVQECLVGFVEAQKCKSVNNNHNLMQWIKNNFGHGMAKHFMIPYNTKFWTMPPQMMSCDWVDGFIPKPTLTQLISGAIGVKKQQLGYNVNFWYPKKGGIGRLALSFMSQITAVNTNTEIQRINLRKKELTLTNGRKVTFGYLISTIPLPLWAELVTDAPRELLSALKQLRWNSILNLNFGLKQKTLSEKHWIYFPHKTVKFFRAGFFHNFSSDLAPKGCASIYVEVAYSNRRPIERNLLVERVRKDMRKVGLMNAGDAIIVTDVNDIKYGYPIYDKNYCSVREFILNYLARYNILPCGRYGSWRYMSMEDAIMDGRHIANKFL